MIMCEMEDGRRAIFVIYTICCVLESARPGYCHVYTSDGEMTTVKCGIKEFQAKLLDARK